MIKNPLIMLVLILSLVVPMTSYANSPSPKPGEAVSNIFNPAGGVMPKGAFGLVLNYTHANKDKVWKDGSSYNALNKNTFNLLAVKFRYGFGNAWDIRTLTPILSNEFSANIPSRNGVGDTVIVLRKQVISQDKGAPLSLAFGLGLQVPTGGTSNDSVGSGAWGLMPEIGFTYALDGGRQIFDGGLNYFWKGTGEVETPTGIVIDDIDQSDAINIFARYVYAINNSWDIGVEAHSAMGLGSEINGKGQNDTSFTLFAGPAVTFKIPSWKASFGISTQFAVFQDWESTNRNGAGSAAESFRIETKFFKAF